MFNKVLTLIGFVLLAKSSSSQNIDYIKPDSAKKEIDALHITSAMHIDGLLNEPEWKLANPAPDFIEVEPFQNSIPREKTEVKVLFNTRFLYFGIFSHDSMGRKSIRATDFKRDFNVQQHDVVSIAIDGFNDKRNAMLFATNPYGVQRDLLVFDDLYYDSDWDGLWKVRTNRTDSGWTAEIAVPWQTLRYKKTIDSLQNWGINIYRLRHINNELSVLSSIPRSVTIARMDYAGVLKNLQPPPPKPNIRIQPYALSSYDHYKNYPASVKREETNFKTGVDLKWAINPNAVLDLTANTDFAQADADRQVNNITRFSVFFPERRQFFLENASLFGVGVSQSPDGSGGSMRMQPFFSRTIGLDDSGNPIPIDAGGRFVYRSEKRNYGAIAMHQRASGSTPGTNFFVGRYSENFGKQSRIGALVTMRNRPDGTNIVSAVDGFFRISENHSINTMIINSAAAKGNRQGFAGFAQYFYNSNQMKIWVTQSVVTKYFNPDMGFVSRTDVVSTTPGMFWYYRGKALPFKKFIRAYEPGFTPEFYYQASTGKLLERTLGINPFWLNLQNSGFIGYYIIPTFQRLTETFAPLGVNIATGEYNFTRHQFWASSDASKKLNLQFIYTIGHYFNGKLNTGEWSLQYAPDPHFSLVGLFNRNHFMNVGSPKMTCTVDLYSLQGRFALNPRVQLLAFYQRNSENQSQNYNIRFSWEYKPLSYIYLVLNRRGFDNVLGRPQTEDHGIAKISYLKQLN